MCKYYVFLPCKRISFINKISESDRRPGGPGGDHTTHGNPNTKLGAGEKRTLAKQHLRGEKPPGAKLPIEAW